MSKLSEAIQTQNIRGIKSSILTGISADPLDRKGEIKKAIATIDAQGIQVWEQFDGTSLTVDRASWTKEYFGELQANLVTDFSKEVLEHTLKVGRHAYREELNQPKPTPTQQSQRTTGPQTRPQGGNADMGKYLMAGAAVIAVGVLVYLVVK